MVAQFEFLRVLRGISLRSLRLWCLIFASQVKDLDRKDRQETLQKNAEKINLAIGGGGKVLPWAHLRKVLYAKLGSFGTKLRF